MNRTKGFTLIEVLIAVAASIIIMAAIYGAVNMGQKSSSGIDRRIASQKDVRGALDLIAMELRMASYNPSLDNSVWRTADCSSATTNPTYKGIQSATASGITIQMDANNSGVINDYANEIITYTYDAANQLITRGTNCGTAQAFLGDTASSGKPRIVKIVNNATGIPLFRYFDFNNNEIAEANLPAQIPMIRAIEITLVADTEYDKDPMSPQPRRVIYSTRVIPRNHGANP